MALYGPSASNDTFAALPAGLRHALSAPSPLLPSRLLFPPRPSSPTDAHTASYHNLHLDIVSPVAAGKLASRVRGNSGQSRARRGAGPQRGGGAGRSRRRRRRAGRGMEQGQGAVAAPAGRGGGGAEQGTARSRARARQRRRRAGRAARWRHGQVTAAAAQSRARRGAGPERGGSRRRRRRAGRGTVAARAGHGGGGAEQVAARHRSMGRTQSKGAEQQGTWPPPLPPFPGTKGTARSDALPFDEIKDVYLLDFVGPPGFVNDIAPKVERVTILDHHKTALETLCGNTTLGENVIKVIDMQRSGATIAFDFFRDKFLTEGKGAAELKYVPDNKVETVHKLFKFIEDGDLWRWKIPNSKAFSSGLKDLDIEFDANTNCKVFDQLLELDPEHVISRGQVTLSEKQRLIEECLDKSYEISLGCGQFGNCLAVNADAISNLRSELGNQLASKSHNMNLRGIGAVVYKVPELNNDQMLKISLRSLQQEDTTSISQEYGGGGHRNASSFMLSVTEFERWKVRDEPSKTKDA